MTLKLRTVLAFIGTQGRVSYEDAKRLYRDTADDPTEYGFDEALEAWLEQGWISSDGPGPHHQRFDTIWLTGTGHAAIHEFEELHF